MDKAKKLAITQQRFNQLVSLSKKFGGADNAEDIVQESILLLLTIQHHTEIKAKLEKYLEGVVVKKTKMWLRDRKRKAAQLSRYFKEKEIIDIILASQVSYVLLKELCEQSNIILLLAAGYTYTEIANILDISIREVRNNAWQLLNDG